MSAKKGYPPDEVLKRADVWARTDTVRILSSLRMRRQKKIYIHICLPHIWADGLTNSVSRLLSCQGGSPDLGVQRGGGRRSFAPPPSPSGNSQKRHLFFINIQIVPPFPFWVSLYAPASGGFNGRLTGCQHCQTGSYTGCFKIIPRFVLIIDLVMSTDRIEQ